VAQAARDIDAGIAVPDLPRRLIEENMWRAIRHGLDGQLLDLELGEPYPAGQAFDRLLEWTAPVRAELGLDVSLPERNGAQRQRAMHASGMTLHEVYSAVVAQTRDTYAGVVPSPAEVSR
jgi:carboxylate-amine ligase